MSMTKYSMLLLIYLLCFATRVLSSIPPPNQTDRLALLHIKSSIVEDPTGVLSTWNGSAHQCNWPGVFCGRHARVTAIDLSNMALVGSLSPSIGNMSFLRGIYLYNNSLSGPIPEEVTKLSHLETCDLSTNLFSGVIPSNLSRCTRLQMLDLGDNNLVGNVPGGLDSMTQLRVFSLHDNDLRGDVRFLGNLTSLQVLDLNSNAFEGRIPDTIGRVTSLLELGLYCQFSGPIPSSIFNLSSLKQLTLGGGPIVGTLPHDIGLTLPLLETLGIRDSLLSGVIPASLSNLSNIRTITLANNSLTGKITISGRNLPSLNWLELSLNYLGSGDSDDLRFVDSFTNNSQLVGLNVYSNQLAGVLPPSLTNLSSLEHLELSTNYFFGGLSYIFDELINLQYLDLSSNKFTGSIPSSMGKLSMLGTVQLSSNKLSGHIPSAIGNLSQITNILIDDNELEGDIPSSIGSCSGLQLLNLSKNHLTGYIPMHLFDAPSLSVALDLSSNRLQGNLPTQVGELKNLALLDVSNNRLSGVIPQSLGQCISLTELYMEGNNFSGSISSGLSPLRGLLHLDLSRNKFSGKIPAYLAGLTLLSLNLSFNNLEGEVPVQGIFSNTSEVSLIGNKGLCGGIKALKLPKCSPRFSSKGSRRRLAAILAASLSCLVIGAVIAMLLVWLCVKRKKQSISQDTILGKSFENVSYSMLLSATDGFSTRNLIGTGGFGSVYRGNVDLKGKETPIAVKVLNLEHHRGANSFMRECKALRNIRHRNLVKIISACSSIDFQQNDFKALVYELMPNGSLDRWLHVLDNEHESPRSRNLTLVQRLNIAIDVACALDYLHNECEVQVIHCDMKPSNILLDDNMVARVGDFGLARLLPDLKDQICSNNTSLGIRGTVGYAAPEYGLGNQVSASGDVYSFGIILLEMLTGKAPSDPLFDNGLCLHEYAKNVNLENLMETIDNMLLEGDHKEIDQQAVADCLLSAVKIGVECSVELPTQRMCIADAIEQLKLARKSLISKRRATRVEAY